MAAARSLILNKDASQPDDGHFLCGDGDPEELHLPLLFNNYDDDNETANDI